VFLLVAAQLSAQPYVESSFMTSQRQYPKVANALKAKEDSLKKQLAAMNISWPVKQIYVRSFKYDSQMEVLVRDKKNEPFKLFKTYKVCALAGTLGPKRMEGDYQVPEGFYCINEFNPKSNYHFSLGLNYPNASDRLLSDSLQPGGDIYIHGSCVTTGCIPITDGQIEELYVLTAYAKNRGQDFIPVHIFPIRFNVKKSADYLEKYLKDFSEYVPLSNHLKYVFWYFEKYHEIPVVMINKKGEYLVDQEVEDAARLMMEGKKVTKPGFVKKKRSQTDVDETEIPVSVHKLPVYPGGNAAFQEFLQKLSKDMIRYLEEDQHTAYIQVEYVVNKDGDILNPRIVKGGNDELNDHLLDAFEAMPKWTPAIRMDKPVPMKLKQTVVVEKPH